MRTVLSAVLAAHRGDQPISRVDVEAQLRRFPFAAATVGDDTQRQLRPLLDKLLDEGGFSLRAGTVGLSGGRGSGGWKLVCGRALARPHPGPARLSDRCARRRQRTGMTPSTLRPAIL